MSELWTIKPINYAVCDLVKIEAGKIVRAIRCSHDVATRLLSQLVGPDNADSEKRENPYG